MNHDVDEPVILVEHDARWAAWSCEDAAEIVRALGSRVRCVEHVGSTAVPGMAAKPIIDVLVAPVEWPLARTDGELLERCGYQHLGEAGVPGREYFRRRGRHDTNLAVVAFDGRLWRDNLLLRDYLRSHPAEASAYARTKHDTWTGGARSLIAYSAAKAPAVAALLDAAKRWRAG